MKWETLKNFAHKTINWPQIDLQRGDGVLEEAGQGSRIPGVLREEAWHRFKEWERVHVGWEIYGLK